MNKQLTLLAFLFFGKILTAQPSNDGCETPIAIPDVTNFCTPVGQFTNAKATDSGYGAAACMATASNDVWFSFVALSTDVNIVIRGKTTTSPGGEYLIALPIRFCRTWSIRS